MSKSHSLSGDEVSELLDGQANIVRYVDLQNYSSIDELLYPYGVAVILYMARPDYGHWTCLFRYPDGETIEYFDSYGYMKGKELIPDVELSWTDKQKREEMGITEPFLSDLLLAYNGPMQFNPYRFQKRGQEIATCGRWCCVRIACRDLNIDEFHDIFKGIKDKDKLVVEATSFIE
jgi:hypothetical protein